MPWVNSTRDRFLGFHGKRETDFSKKFFEHLKPVGMDKFKSILLSNNQFPVPSNKIIKNSLNNDENPVKNSLDIRSKITNTDKIEEFSKKSQYEIFALLTVAGRTS